MGEGEGSNAVMLLNHTSAVMLLNRTGGEDGPENHPWTLVYKTTYATVSPRADLVLINS